MEVYLEEILKLSTKKPVLEAEKSLELGKDKRIKPLSSLNSKTLRHDQTMNRDIPGPGSYNTVGTGIRQEQSKRNVQNFGTLVKRESLLLRDL